MLQTGQAAARQMVEQNKMQPGRGGCIINMSSVNAVMAIPTIAGYNASKGGVNNLTRSAPLLYMYMLGAWGVLQVLAGLVVKAYRPIRSIPAAAHPRQVCSWLAGSRDFLCYLQSLGEQICLVVCDCQ